MNMEFKCHHEEEEEEDSKAVSSSEEEEEEAAVCVRSYECVFCKRGFATAQALGGHMNIHRKDRAANKTSRPTVSTQLGGDHVSPYRAIQGYPVRPHDYNHHHHYDYDYGYDYYYYSSSRTTGTTAHVNYQTFDINMITPAAVAASTWGLRLPRPPEVVLVGHRSHPFCPPNSLHPKYPYTSPQEEEEEDDDDDHDHNQNGGCSISTLELDLELRLGYGP